MLSLLKRAVARVIFHIMRVLLRPIEAVHARLYMKIYIKLLKSYGLKITGSPRYISSSVRFDRFDLVKMGDRVVISRNVILLTHDYSLTTALCAIGETPETDISVNKTISIGDNVFIGMNVIILPGTEIGSNVIIAAGSVIRGRIPSDSIMAGNPAVRLGGILDRAADWKARRYSDASASDFA